MGKESLKEGVTGDLKVRINQNPTFEKNPCCWNL